MGIPSFWRHTSARYTLVGTRCVTYGRHYFPPRTMCPICRRDGIIGEYQFEGTGEVVTYTVIHAPAEGYSGPMPYALAVIKLDEGPRLTGQIVSDPEGVRIGMRVERVFRKLGEDGKDGIIYYGTKFAPIS